MTMPVRPRPLVADRWPKALAIFVFLVLTVLIAILLERKVLGPDADAAGPQPGRAVRACCKSWPTASSWRSRKAIIPAGVDRLVYLAGPGHLGHPGVHRVRGHPDGRRGVGVRSPHRRCSSPTCPSRCLHPGRHVDRRVRHRAGRLGVRLHLPAAGRRFAPPPR